MLLDSVLIATGKNIPLQCKSWREKWKIKYIFWTSTYKNK